MAFRTNLSLKKHPQSECGSIRATSSAPYRSIEPCQVDRVAHLAVAAVARVEAVAAIVRGAHLGRDLGVAQRGVEIGDRIERTAGAYPLVDRDAVLFAGRVPGVRHKRLVAERGQRRADDPDPRTM